MGPRILFCFLAVLLALTQASANWRHSRVENHWVKPLKSHENEFEDSLVISLKDGEKEQYFNRDYKSAAYSTGYNVNETQHFDYKNSGPDGITYGCYGLINAFDKLQATHYVSDRKGYRVVNPEDPIKVYPKDKYLYDKSSANQQESGQTVPWSKLFFPNGCGKNAGKITFEQSSTPRDNVPSSPKNPTVTWTWTSTPVTTRIPPQISTQKTTETPERPRITTTPRTPGSTTRGQVPSSPKNPTVTWTPWTWTSTPVTTRIPPQISTQKTTGTPERPRITTTPRTPGSTTRGQASSPKNPTVTWTPWTWTSTPVTTRIPPQISTQKTTKIPERPGISSTPCTPGDTTREKEYPGTEPKNIPSVPYYPFPIYVINYTVPTMPGSCPCYLLNPGSNYTPTLGQPPAQYPPFNQNQVHAPYGIIGFLPVVFVPYCPGNSNGMNIVQQNFQNAVPVQYNCAQCQANRGVNRYVRDLKGEPSTNFGDLKEIHSLTELEDLLKQIKPMKKGLKRIGAQLRILDETNDNKNVKK